MTAPTADATMEREILELALALMKVTERPLFALARAHPIEAADGLGLGGRVREAFIVALSGEGARTPVGFHGGGHAFWRN